MNDKFKLDVFFGHIETISWIEFDGEKLIGMAMKKWIDKDGSVIKSEIKPTGAVARYV